MKRAMKILVTIAIVIAMISGRVSAKTSGTGWSNYGYCASTDTWDANTVKGTTAQWSSLITNFTTISDGNNHTLWIPVPAGYDYIDLRFRGSAVNTSGTAEILQIAGPGDAEYQFDVALTADASAAAATSIVDGNDLSMTTKHGGYYFGNVTDSNSANMLSNLLKNNCDTTHRACDLCWDVQKSTTVIVHFKTVSNGTIYYDACFWRDEPR